MPFPRIEFTDATGAATLTNGNRRFFGWTPDTDPWADREEVPALGTVAEFTLAERRTASFRVEQCAPSVLDTILRLKRHLLAGGQATVHTEDIAARVYTVGLRGGTVPQVLFDPAYLEYGLALQVVNLGSTANMLCIYRA